MKKIMLFVLAFMALFATNGMAQTPWKIIDMEFVTDRGGNCEYDDENCIATFKERYNRWVDLPGLNGDLTGHTKLKVDILKSNVILRFCVRYRDTSGKIQQVDAQTFYGSMGKEIKTKKTLNVDLTNGGKLDSEIFKDITSIRVAMAKPASGAEEPYFVQFGQVVVE